MDPNVEFQHAAVACGGDREAGAIEEILASVQPPAVQTRFDQFQVLAVEAQWLVALAREREIRMDNGLVDAEVERELDARDPPCRRSIVGEPNDRLPAVRLVARLRIHRTILSAAPNPSVRQCRLLGLVRLRTRMISRLPCSSTFAPPRPASRRTQPSRRC